MPVLDLADIQGDVVAPYATTYSRYMFWDFGELDRRAIRRLLWSCRPTTAAERVGTRPGTTTRNIAFSAAGMIALGLAPDAVQDLPLAFRAGMRSRHGELGDRGSSSPPRWEQWSQGPLHAMVTVTGWTARACDREVDRLALMATPVHVQEAAAIDRACHEFTYPPPPAGDRRNWRYEYFGFRDGVSNPVLEGSSTPVRGGDGTWRDGRWLPVKPGEFILGYEDDTRRVDLPRSMRRIFRNGTFVVWRKLRQDVAGFRELARRDPHQRGGADLVGRWRDGAPLALHPATTTEATNDFTYAGDPLGRLCPVSAHIRRVNPRDGIDFASDTVSRHRIIRRGMPYRSGDDRGLIFVCFNADIERQFEFIQRRWIIEDPARVTAPRPDPIAAPAAGRSLSAFVTTRAGEYFFQPGLLGLAELLWCADQVAP